MQKLPFKPIDYALILIFILIIIASILLLPKSKGESKMLVAGSPKGEYIYSMSQNGLYSIEGVLGISIIQIEDGQAWFVDSPCPNKTCVQSGRISNNGDWAACLPNDVFIRIEESSSAQMDATAF